MRVLVIEDSVTDRMLVEAFLHELGHQVVLCDHPKEALKIFTEDDFDLVLLDVMMPDIPGYEVAKQIREYNPNEWIPIIFLSARVEPSDIEAGIQAGGDDYLTKPINKTILSSKMMAMNRIAKMRHELIDVTEKLSSANELLKSMVNQDGLTGLSNRRHLESVAKDFIQLCAIKSTPISVIMIDVDHFKAYNDTYGHLMGDDCLKAIADHIKQALTDIGHLACRYGGEEFAIILPNCDLKLAQQTSEKIRQLIEQKKIAHKASIFSQVTISAGVYTETPSTSTSLNTLIDFADQALYEAKHDGRNCIRTSASSLTA